MVSVHELIPSIGNSATRTTIVGVMVAVVFSTVFLLNQVSKLDRTPIEEALEELIFMPSNAFAQEAIDSESKKTIAQDAYNNAIIEANIVYQRVLENENADSEEKERAKQAFTQALLDAKVEYEKTLAEIEVETTYASVKEARDAYNKTLLDARAAYEKAISEAVDDEEISAAKQTFNKTVLDAQAAYEKAKAELEDRR